jgi:osmotically-inducible protein OsmY
MTEHRRDLRDQGHSPYLAEHVRSALAAGETAELGVDVAVAPSGVYLTGTVASDQQRAEVGRVAASAAEGLPVHNDVTVVHADPDPDVEVLS